MDITATYSPEDNKLRLYPSERLDAETFEKVKAAGYRWAPKQELFVAPAWSTSREDLALELAGEIEAEGTTMAERAQIKAERLDNIAQKRAQEATGYAAAARAISERFAQGQPILIGHHSEKKARKDAERMDKAKAKASEAHNAISYWMYRASGVERHANRKNDAGVRARRIKKLLAELRDLQRTINAAHTSLATWQKMTTPEKITNFLNYSDLAFASYGMWSDVTGGKVTPEEAKRVCVARCEATISSERMARRINHTLNRLAYEKEMQGETPRHTEEITPTMLQMFVREHGADKPKGAKVDDDLFTIECRAPLPAHIGDGHSLELSGDEWRDLMQACGYFPPAKKASKPPLLNLDIEEIKTDRFGKIQTRKVVRLTKAEHKQATRFGGGWVELSVCKSFRFRSLPDPKWTGPMYSAPMVAAFLTDSKAHAAPEVTA